MEKIILQNKEIILVKAIEIANNFNKNKSAELIKNIKPIGVEHEYWDVGITIKEDLLYDLMDVLEKNEVIPEGVDYEEFKDFMYDINVIEKMFDILVKPILEYYEKLEQYNVEVDSFWEHIYVYDNEYSYEEE